ncbi:MAG: hypothetical protein IPM66_06965 [Acidobacteriota bacterium]|nr:MAG: hypothetical protein IPM66_06965 [Acidobacteriota bacterium]
MRKSLTVVCMLLLVVLFGYLPLPAPAPRETQPANAAEILKFNVPAVTHGFTRTAFLPDGDLFLLPRPVTLAVIDAPAEAYTFPVNVENFGGYPEEVGALPNTEPLGLSFSKIGSRVEAVACAESLWDGNFIIASTPGTRGDAVRLFLRNIDGTSGPELAKFTVAGAGVQVTSLHEHLMLFVNNRLATGPSWHTGDFIPFAAYAGSSGMRTDLLTLAWPMGFFSPLQGCYQIGIEISRGDETGTTSVVVTDFVVNRNRVAGDENNAGIGLLSRLTGGYPSGFPCKEDCPFPNGGIDPNLPGVGDPLGGETCNAICFRSPRYFLLNVNRLPHGTVLIGGVNYNRPVSTTNTRAMILALRGGHTPLQQLNHEFVAAQLNGLLAGGAGSPKYFYAMEGRLSCYNLQFDPITLDNGFILSPETKLKELYEQARFSILQSRPADQIRIAGIFDLLNGNNPLGACHNQ